MNKQTSERRIEDIIHTIAEEKAEPSSPLPNPKIILMLDLLKKLSSAFSELMESIGNRKAALSNQLNHIVLEKQLEQISRWPDSKTVQFLLHLYPLVSRQLRRAMGSMLKEGVHHVDVTKIRIQTKPNPRSITERHPDLIKWLYQVF